MDNLIQLNDHSRQEGQQYNPADMAHRESRNLEQIAQPGDKENSCQQTYAGNKSQDAGFISSQAQLKNGLDSAAVEAMEQTGQGSSSKSHRHCQPLACGFQADEISAHSSAGNQRAVNKNPR